MVSLQKSESVGGTCGPCPPGFRRSGEMMSRYLSERRHAGYGHEEWAMSARNQRMQDADPPDGVRCRTRE